MQFLDLTLETAAENVALDEALLEWAEQAALPTEVLRFWEPYSLIVVVGCSSRAADEVKLDECRRRDVPVLRRPSGGAAIVTGAGCLMYSIVLSYEKRPELRSIGRAHQFVLDTIGTALQTRIGDTNICRAGTSDLAIANRKFSGNSIRCKRTHLLYHGTLLYDFPLKQVESLLQMPSRQPDYRAGRGHHDFLMNLPLSVAALRQEIKEAFNAQATPIDWPREQTAQLVAEKYCCDSWNLRL
ncbi:MAG: lipoate--protein ligase family protein [Pirellulales bacterium]|nr:lipoate--protein ligase family protein [Pirellulales bacterium]